MKKILSLSILVSLCCVIPASAQSLITLQFSDASSINDWSAMADAQSQPGEVLKSWLGGGNPAGSMELYGVSTTGAPRAYIWEFAATGLPAYGGDVTVEFDLLLTEPLVASAIHFLSNNPGPGFLPAFNLENQGLNASTWTHYSVPINGITAGTTTFNMSFQIASGAVANAGGAIAIDNVTVVPEPSTYAALLGLAAIGLVLMRRRIK